MDGGNVTVITFNPQVDKVKVNPPKVNSVIHPSVESAVNPNEFICNSIRLKNKIVSRIASLIAHILTKLRLHISVLRFALGGTIHLQRSTSFAKLLRFF